MHKVNSKNANKCIKGGTARFSGSLLAKGLPGRELLLLRDNNMRSRALGGFMGERSFSPAGCADFPGFPLQNGPSCATM